MTDETWYLVSDPPPVNTPVLVYTTWKEKKIAELSCHNIDDCTPKWQSCCSERWNLDGGITHWTYLPEDPI